MVLNRSGVSLGVDGAAATILVVDDRFGVADDDRRRR